MPSCATFSVTVLINSLKFLHCTVFVLDLLTDSELHISLNLLHITELMCVINNITALYFALMEY